MQDFAKALALCAAAAMLGGCAGAGAVSHPDIGAAGGLSAHKAQPAVTLPQHVIVIVQENRSFDNLFQGFPGADTQSFGYNTLGDQVPLTELPLGTQYDPNHSHGSFVTEFRAGGMNGCGPA